MNNLGRSFIALALVVGLSPAALATPTMRTSATVQASQTTTEYVVAYADGASLDAARQAVAALGGTILKENTQVGVATIATSNASFLTAVETQPALLGAARNRPIGNVDPNKPRLDKIDGLGSESAEGQAPAAAQAVGVDPLTNLQWDMAMIGATASGSYAKQPGDKRVLVGIIDSGIDASHPDLAPNFSARLSRNFTTDIPSIDGPCEYESCVDPAGVDNSGHGTHVAGTVAAALNGLGMTGVAPNVTLVNMRAGQDSGYLFMQPVVDALIYSGDIGADVVNMSFYVDPWLFNCPSNPADSPESQMEQRTILATVQRALDYARERGVTLVASAGNGHMDLGNPLPDTSSPDYPAGIAYPRIIDNATCRVMPVEGEGVIPVSSVGPSKAKADYSNYGTEQVVVAAPGGYFRDLFGTPGYRQNVNQILSTYPKNVLEARGLLTPDGTPRSSTVIRDCQNGVCGYYSYLQGTSMAAPHATGVVALIVSEYGTNDGKHPGGLKLNPVQAEKILIRSATETACPEPRTVDYTTVGRSAEFNATCEGTAEFNGFYGYGIVNALDAVTGPRGLED